MSNKIQIQNIKCKLEIQNKKRFYIFGAEIAGQPGLIPPLLPAGLSSGGQPSFSSGAYVPLIVVLLADRTLFRTRFLGTLMTLSLILGQQAIFPGSLAQAEARQCAVVKNEAKKIFEGKYKQEDGALLELAKRTVKAYTLIIQNKACVSSKEYKEMLAGIRDLRKGCVEAKKEELAWMIMKDMCKIYAPLYKYVK